MSKPGIENKKGLPWKWIAAAGVLGAGALALSQCGKEEQPENPAPEQTTAPSQPQQSGNSYIYLYTATEDIPMTNPVTNKVITFVKQGSCMQSLPGAEPQGNMRQVSAMSANGVDASAGLIDLTKVRGSGILTGGVSCTAEFIQAAPSGGNAQVQVPASLFAVQGTAKFYDTDDRTGAVKGISGDGSCVVSTGIERGDMMQVKIKSGPNDQEKGFWTPKENYRPAQSFLTPATCFAKLDM